MKDPANPQAIATDLCQFARANFVSEGAAFDERSSLAEAGIDSFGLFQMLLYGERAFGIRIPPSHLTRQNLASIATLAACMAELARQEQSSG
jgi:acyl carrier protein